MDGKKGSPGRAKSDMSERAEQEIGGGVEFRQREGGNGRQGP